MSESSNRIPNRRARRIALRYQGILRKKAKARISSWMNITQETIKNGREIFEANRDATDKIIVEQLEAKELKLIEHWKSLGYTQNEIERLRDANAIFIGKYMETWHQDKKLARQIIKDVNKALYERKHD